MKKTFILAICFSLMQAAVTAQEERPNGMKTTLAIGGTLTGGNSDTMQVNAALVTEGEKKFVGSLRAGLEGTYGETKADSKTDTNVQNGNAFVEANKTITEKTFVGVNANIFHDDMAKVDYRETAGFSLGIYPIKNDKVSLMFEAGPSYVWEKVDKQKDDYLAIRIAQRFDYNVTPTAKIWESAAFIPKSDKIDDYLRLFEAGIDLAINSYLNTRIVLQSKHDSTPAKDLKKDDTMLIVGITATFPR